MARACLAEEVIDDLKGQVISVVAELIGLSQK